MTSTPANVSTSALPVRLRPGAIIAAVQAVSLLVVPLVVPDAAMFGILGGVVCGLAILGWWLFFSRAPWIERLGAIVLMVIVALLTRPILHPSIAGGMTGLMHPIFSIPVLSFALVAWAVASRRLARGLRRAMLPVVLVLASGVMLLVRTDGIAGNGAPELHWRWTPTAEERLLASTSPSPAASVASPPATSVNAQWSSFRGPQRDGIVRGTRIAADWSRTPPVELWRRPVGPAWSSFAVDGNFFFTQEQRGDEEIVSCYLLATGAPVWSHADPARFWESNAGAGPRGTPTLAGGRVYTLGGTGILNALDARNGSVVWSRHVATDTRRKTPEWGFASSPLVAGDRIIVAVAGVLAAYDTGTGAPRWVGPKEGSGYSSPHLATIAGVEQVVLLNGAGAIGVALADGRPLWDHAWKSDGIVQPVLLAGGDVLLGSGSGIAGKVGVRRVAITHGTAGWTAEERWTSNRLKPYFNDFVVHADHAYGFDGNGLACIELTAGDRKWKGGRYGAGQLILLADQDLLLVLSEKGELALVKAAPGEFAELARVPAITGKTWNHPVLAGDILLVRNSEEMAAFRLP